MLDFKFGMNWQYGEKRGSFTLIHRPFLEGIKNYAPAFMLIAEDVLEPHVMRQFSTEGRADLGRTWQALAPSTLRGRPSTPILQISGGMMRSFQRGDPNHEERITPLKLVWGSRDPKSLFHEFGTGKRTNFKTAGARKVVRRSPESRVPGHGSSGVPARPMLVYSRFLANEITSKMLGRIAQVARQAGYRVGSRMFGGLTPVEARQVGQALLQG